MSIAGCQSSGRYSTKKVSRHDSLALSGELEARKAEEQIMLDAIIPLYHQYGGHVNPDLVNFSISCPDVPLVSCQQVDCGLPRSPFQPIPESRATVLWLARTDTSAGAVATPSPDRNSASVASKHTYCNPFRKTRNRVKWQPRKTIENSPGRITHS